MMHLNFYLNILKQNKQNYFKVQTMKRETWRKKSKNA